MRSVYSGIKAATAVRPTTITGTGTPVAAAISEVDTWGYNSLMFDVAVGSPTGTAISYVVTFQIYECATSGGSFTAVTGATGTITGTTTSAVLRAQVGLDGLNTGDRKRYMKITPLVTMDPDDSSVIPISATALLGRAFVEPVDNTDDESY